MKVAVIGSRNCGNFQIEQLYAHLPPECTRIISGGAAGVDSLAMRVAGKLDIPFTCILPDYKKYGRAAPLVRNRKIVERADLVLAFWDFHSRGTANTIATCIELGVPVRIIGIDDKISDTVAK